jgi:1-acyl-sn-glycerol-3-phosphate acyltransferase
MIKRFMRWFFNLLSRILVRFDIEGIENLPGTKPYIMVTNHLSIYDVALVFAWLGDEDTSGWAAEKWENHPIAGPLLRMGGGVFIQRGEVDRGALSSAVRWLQAGKVWGMAPEGTRSPDGTMKRGKTGVAYLADSSGALIVPMGLVGAEKITSSLKRLRRQRVSLRIGVPFKLPPLDGDNRAASLRANTDEVMCRIAALLPESYRGIYADRPRTKELLAEAKA